jgi:hypothetical protein
MAPIRMSALAACLLASALWAAAPARATQYALVTPPSQLEIGCQGPCACPLVIKPTYGSFELVPAGSDPLFTYYDVVNYIASYNNGPGAIAITGSGHYRIGGEFALVEQMTLDLVVEGQPAVHFDSGLTPVTVTFPQIDLSCAVHGFACYDSVLRIAAKPIDVAGALGPPQPSIGLRAAWPNPFTQRISIAFALDRKAVVDLRIVDLAGRQVRRLAAAQALGPGPQEVGWDGRGDDGRSAPAGVYWVLMRWAGGADQRRIIKLR